MKPTASIAIALAVFIIAIVPSCMQVAAQAAENSQPAPFGMVWVPGGEFTVGWDGEGGRPDEGPAHRVRVGMPSCLR